MCVQAIVRRVTAVIDTNAVLDAWFFCDPRAAAMAAAVEAGTVQWVACGRMRDELKRTLAYPQLARWWSRGRRTPLPLQMFDRLAQLHPEPPHAPPVLRCSDSDDQMFIDLALDHRAHWLISHDRALLSLHRQAKLHGIHIIRPTDWLP